MYHAKTKYPETPFNADGVIEWYRLPNVLLEYEKVRYKVNLLLKHTPSKRIHIYSFEPKYLSKYAHVLENKCQAKPYISTTGSFGICFLPCKPLWLGSLGKDKIAVVLWKQTTYAACRWQKSQTESVHIWHILNALIITDPPQVPGPAFIHYQITTPIIPRADSRHATEHSTQKHFQRNFKKANVLF